MHQVIRNLLKRITFKHAVLMDFMNIAVRSKAFLKFFFVRDAYNKFYSSQNFAHDLAIKPDANSKLHGRRQKIFQGGSRTFLEFQGGRNAKTFGFQWSK